VALGEATQAEGTATGDELVLPVETLEESYDIIAPKIAEIVERMYKRLFEIAPRTVKIFEGRDASRQRRTIEVMRESFDDLSILTPELEALGARHASWGVKEEDYGVMGTILLESMAAAVDPYWRSEYTTAWATLWQVVEQVMLEGAAKAQAAK
jgi:hemoglobin-like flavoprotein